MGQKNVACCDNQKEIFDEEGKKKSSILAFFGENDCYTISAHNYRGNGIIMMNN